MRAFTIKAFLFSIPLIALLISLEAYLFFHANSFNTKAAYLKSNAAQIECLFLGSSHTAGSINPELMTMHTSNMAHAKQDPQLDSALFFHYIPKMKNLKYVFIEINYHSLEFKNEPDAMRVPWYYRYHGIKIYEPKFLHRFSIFATSPNFFKTYIVNKLNPYSRKSINNKYGFSLIGIEGVFQELNYNEAEIFKTAEKRIKNRVSDPSVKNYSFNKRKMLSIIDYCLANNIQVVFLKTPFFTSYKKYYNSEKLALRDEFIKTQRAKDDRILLLDFENDERFTVRDFANDDHLTFDGAQKLTLLVNEAIMNQKK